MSHAELDVAAELDAGRPAGSRLPVCGAAAGPAGQLTVLGGCCGTDHRHIDAIRAGVRGGGRPPRLRLRALVDPDHVSGGVAEGTVPYAVGLVDRLLEHLRARCAHLLERGIEVRRTEDHGVERALGQQTEESVAILFRVTGMRLEEDDLDIRLGRRGEGQPAVALGLDVGSS